MKLPENRQERIKLFVMIGLGVILVLLGVIQGIINPLVTSRRDREVRLEELLAGTDRARSEVRAAARSVARRMETVSDIMDASDRFILHPVIGNYLLQAQALIETIARVADVEIEPVREIGISEIPSTGSGPQQIKGYGARIVMQTSFHALTRFLRALEAANPYLAVTGISITGRGPGDPVNHAIAIEVQWPVWSDPEMPRNLEAQLEEDRRIADNGDDA